jgi:acetyltransferase-like isoleucine patch superfamily enzyme
MYAPLARTIRNPLTMYLRYVANFVSNSLKYRDFAQEYMSSVDDCVIESHVRISAQAIVRACTIGGYTYIGADTQIARTDIGRFCSIGPACRIGLGNHPTRDFVSTSPVFFSMGRQCGTTFVRENAFRESEPIAIGNDVWIGANVFIADGVTIGNGAIIGAGAVVVRDVPDYAVYGGVPARLLRYRFERSQIEWLQEFKWWNRDPEWLRANHSAFWSITDLMQTAKAKPAPFRPEEADS